jgi:hypothetical protein
VLGLAGYVDGRRGHGGGGRSPVIVVNARVCVLWYLVESTTRIRVPCACARSSRPGYTAWGRAMMFGSVVAVVTGKQSAPPVLLIDTIQRAVRRLLPLYFKKKNSKPGLSDG